MKKIIITLGVLALTGCSNELVCTMKKAEETYVTEQKIVFKFDDNDKIMESDVKHVMIFEDEKAAKNYFEAFKSLKEDYDMYVENNKIIINTSMNYEEYSYTKEELKEEMEKNEFSCK